MRERVGVLLALLDDATDFVLESDVTGYIMLCMLWLTIGVCIGANIS